MAESKKTTYAIIAAGEGSRLAGEGVSRHKPLVEVGGERLVDRLVRIFNANGADRIAIAYRRGMDDVKSHIEWLQHAQAESTDARIEAVEAETPSSMHTMLALAPWLDKSRFCLTTVDTVFSEKLFSRYISYFNSSVDNGSADGVMAVTRYIDDESPLYVSTDGDMNITGFLDTNCGCTFVSAGIYGLTPRAVDVLRRCVARGESRMRNFQRALLAEGFRLKAFDIGKAFDIDHAADISKACMFLQEDRE